MKKIVHLTSVHSPKDPRIFSKQCRSLAKNGYEVVLIAPHTQDEVLAGIQIKKVPAPGNSYERITKTMWHVYITARKEKADIYHFHDPELIFVGLMLRLTGAKVIYDVHEDYITSVQQKGYIPKLLRSILAFGVKQVEKIAQKAFFIVLAEKYYEQRFPEGCKILNYPAFSPIYSPDSSQPSKNLLYTGTVSEDRGALNLAYMARHLKGVTIYMIGKCSPDLHEKMKRITGGDTNKLQLKGVGEYVPHSEIISTYEKGGWLAGLALFPATPHYINKELTKFFEYMAAGIPILCSDFSVWRDLVEQTGAGICVNPDNMKEVSDAIDYLYNNPEERRNMGRAGQLAVRNTYNWEKESAKLIGLYKRILYNDKVPEFEPA